MCGITGLIDFSHQNNRSELESVIIKMTARLNHRGPDDTGVWVDEHFPAAFGHRRLSIIDLSTEGRQPMVSSDGRYVLVYNGEIYNYKDLRKELISSGHGFRGHSDTEVMLAAFCQWGIEKSLKRFNGMFAFGLWDRFEKKVYLSRDRFGEKPLYYGWMGKKFIFASELKALVAHPEFNKPVDRNVLSLFLKYNYIPAPYSIYEGIKKLSASVMLTVSGHEDDQQPFKYWDLKNIAQENTLKRGINNEQEQIDALDALLKDAVGKRMVSDVPLGAFLSGGIDSSLIVSQMQAQSTCPVKTVTIGFNESFSNEAKAAKKIAAYLGTDHYEYYVGPSEMLDVIPGLPRLYDEPFADSSQIPTYLVSKIARQRVTVCLSGDGGDEFFCGYNHYLWGKKIWDRIGWIHPALRRSIGKIITSIPPGLLNTFLRSFQRFIPAQLSQNPLGDVLHKLAEIISCKTPTDLYTNMVTQWKNPETVVIDNGTIGNGHGYLQTCPQLDDYTHMMMYMDMVSYLSDDILAKVDRASMGVSLEVRVPYLDHRIAEFSWRIPLSMKIRDNKGKWLLRQVLKRYLPADLIDQSKTGFSIPLDVWLRGPLKDWAESLLSREMLKNGGFFYPEPIRKKWNEHISGMRNWQNYLWSILMFQAWLNASR
ncbi:asparagine synthase (glutamine-hydrolyzing) [Desulfobacula sp.]|uniref:asparagine synthase (glutamine-hydrolyzing) n=1 Tax=Desulfobacula sp. TaxID=2593537 RepID=UPI002631997E|nr:asparagine synthase (glutamine-hydrolyzing) [Desulfobacula sp.]